MTTDNPNAINTDGGVGAANTSGTAGSYKPPVVIKKSFFAKIFSFFTGKK